MCILLLSLNFDAQPTVSKHHRQEDVALLVCQHTLQDSSMWTLLNKSLISIHSLWQSVNLNQQSTLDTAHVCVSLYRSVIYNRAQNSSNDLPLILQTVIIAWMLSTGGQAEVKEENSSKTG